MTNNKKQVTVGLLWHSLSSDNLGVGALTESQIAICNAAAEQAGVKVRYIVFGTLGGSSYVPANVDIKFGSRISIKQIITGRSPFMKELSECDLVLDIGEGDSFTDIYGLKRYLFLMISKMAVLYKKKPLVLSPQTIGPFDRWYTRILAFLVMKRASRVFARDGLSKAYLDANGLQHNIDEVIDVAFRLPFVRPELKSDGKTHIGLNVSGLLYSGGYTGNNQFGLTVDYKAMIEKLIETWLADSDLVVWLIPHVLSDDFPNDDDRVAIELLIKKYPSLQRAPNFKSPSEAKSFISGMDFVTGARMHACIAAFSSGVPVVPFAYSRKFNGLFSSLGYKFFSDGKADSTDEACQRIAEGLSSRNHLKTAVLDGLDVANKKLISYQEFLTKLFQSVVEN